MSTNTESLRVKARLLTPLHIGQGKERALSPYAEFVQDGSYLRYLDQEKIQHVLENNTALVDEYVRGIKDGMENNRSTFALKDFITARLGLALDEVTRVKVSVRGKVEKNHIACFITSAGRPFIPGSSMKGALNTALIYSWLTRDASGQRELDSLLQGIERAWKESGPLIEELLALQEKPNGGNRRERIEIIRRLKRAGDSVGFNTASLLEREIAPPGNKREIDYLMRRVHVSDSDILDKNSIVIRQVERIKLKDGSTVSPQWSEVLPPGTEFAFTIKIVKDFPEGFLSIVNDGIDEIWRMLNEFSAAAIQYDISRLKDLKQNPEILETARTYGELKAVVPSEGAMYGIMRLGRYKNYFDNSIGLAVYHRNPEAFSKFQKLHLLGQNPETKAIPKSGFPTTRSIVKPERIPLGWIALGEGELPLLEGIRLGVDDVRSELSSAASQVSVARTPIKQNFDTVEIVDVTKKPIQVRVLTGAFAGALTILPEINPEGLGLKNGDKVYVNPRVVKNRLEKVEYKGKV